MNKIALVTMLVCLVGMYGCKPTDTCTGTVATAKCPGPGPAAVDVCAHLKAIECSAGVSDKCAVAVQHLVDTGDPPTKCWIGASTKADAETCGQIQCGK